MPERIVIEEERDKAFRQQHLARYEFAASYAKGKTVLDVASGTGYGAAILAESGASKAIGIDRSEEAIEYAGRTYRLPRLEFMKEDLETLEKLPNADLIVSFETIEHLRDPRRFLTVVRSALNPQGIFIISTPIRRDRHNANRPANPYHFQEWSIDEFSELLRHYFREIQFLYQFNFKKRWYPFSRTLGRFRANLFHSSLAKKILDYPVVQSLPFPTGVPLEREYIVATCKMK